MPTPAPSCPASRPRRRARARTIAWVAAAALGLGTLAVQGEIPPDAVAWFHPAQPYEHPAATPARVLSTQSRLVAVGADAQGQWSAWRMLLAWRQAGIDIDTARTLLVALHQLALPTILGRDDPGLAVRHAHRVEALDRAVAQQLPQPWARLARIGPSTPLAFEPVSQLAADPDSDVLLWMETFSDLELIGPAPTGLPDHAPAPTVPQALEDLARATHDVGLKELHVPLATWGDAQRMADLAAGLRQANADLATVSGWSGPVLGLDGRLSLTPGTLDDALVDGHPASGEVLDMESNWRDLGHEWLHAVDFVLARHALPHARPVPLSAQRDGWIQKAQARPAALAWWRAQDRILAAGQPWVARRRAAQSSGVLARLSATRPYWVDPSELMAFSWENHVRHHPGLRLLGANGHGQLEPDPLDILAPRASEQQAMDPAWPGLLHAAGRDLGLCCRPLAIPANQ